MIPYTWADEPTPPDINVKSLDDSELANLTEYRAVIALSTIPGHGDYLRATCRLTEVWKEQMRRGQRG